jgi:hypothetical protein
MISTFVWHDLFTHNRKASMEFYGALFGYTFKEEDGRTVFSNEDGPQGAMIDLDQDLRLPPHWLPYLTVKSTTDAAFRVGAGGGRLLGSSDSFVVFTDVEGAQLKIVQGHTTPSVDSKCPGSIAFDELLCTNPKQSIAFLQNITNWNVNSIPLWPSGEYHFCTDGDSDVAIAGIRTVNPQTVTSSFWISHFKSNDLKQSVEKVVELGGSIVTPYLPLPGYGLSAVVQDNLGSIFAILE